MMPKVPTSLTSALFMGLRIADAPAMADHLRFAKLRQRYYDLFWNRVAGEIGADIRKWDMGFRRLTRNGLSVLVHAADLGLDSHLTLKLMGNKAMTYELMAEQGVVVPRHVRFSVTNLSPAKSLLTASQRPLVVKPNSGTGGGRGVTTGIITPGELRRAAFWAARFDTDLIAEEQVEGHSYRVLVLDGMFVDAIRRDPPRVTGDGRRTIAQLMRDETQHRLKAAPFTALSPLRLDRDAANFLTAQMLSPRTVPEDGEIVIVKRAANENSAAENVVVTDKIHPSTVAACTALAANLGVRLAGIDIIARDIARPLGAGNGLIGEINTTPGLHHHDLISSPRPEPSVASRVINHMFERGAGIIRHPVEASPPSALKVAAE